MGAHADGLVRVDERGTVTAVYSGAGQSGLAVSDDAVWFVDKLDRTLYRIPLVS